MKAAVYLRQSLDRTGEGLAVARQREDCLKLCDQRGWTPVEYCDNDTSASVGRRPQYERMLADIRNGSIGAVVVWDLDRLHRRPVELEHFITLADEKRLALATVGGDADLSTDNGRLFARIKGAVARAEVERKSARQKAAAAQRAKTGAAWWSSRPFGYTDTKGTALHPEESELVRNAYRFMQLGGSLNAIAKEWNSNGITTPKGNQWRGAQVRQLLINPRNCARRFYDGVDVGEGSWPAIVDVDTWRSVVAILENPERRSGPTRGRKFVLSGIAICGVCEQPLKSGFASSTKYPVYLCKESFHVSRRMDEVDEWVTEHAVARLSQPDALNVLVNKDRPDVDALRGEAATLRSRLDDLAAEFADGVLTPSQVRIATERVKAKLADVERQMFDADAYHVFDGLIGADKPRELFDALPLPRKRAVIDRLMTVTVFPAGKGKVFDPKKVVIKFKGAP
ncbi:recombinase family protein [Mycolicibacterium sp. XJ870]